MMPKGGWGREIRYDRRCREGEKRCILTINDKDGERWKHQIQERGRER